MLDKNKTKILDRKIKERSREENFKKLKALAKKYEKEITEWTLFQEGKETIFPLPDKFEFMWEMINYIRVKMKVSEKEIFTGCFLGEKRNGFLIKTKLL